MQDVAEVEVPNKPCDFRELLASNKARHFAGTREWLFDAVRKWLRTERRLFWLVGGAGTGKSVVSAKLFDAVGVHESIVAWHFCRHNHAAESDLRVIIRSWSAMLLENLPLFELPEGASQAFSGSAEDMFDLLIAQPLKNLEHLTKPVLIVLDALDELPQESLRLMLRLLTETLDSLPLFVRFFITSRDEAVIKAQMRQFIPLELKVDDIYNREDLRSYLAEVAKRHVKMDLTIADMEAKLEREFGLSPLSLKDCLSKLEDPIRKSKDTYDVVVQKLKLQTGYTQLLQLSDIPGSLLMQTTNDLNELYEDAKVAREKLLAKFASEWEVYKTIGSTVLRVPVAGKAAPFVDRVIDPGVKEIGSAQRKIRDDYAGNARFMKDLARLTAECRNCERLYQVLKFLTEQKDICVRAQKNKFINPSPLGYRDFNLSVEVQFEDGHSHICEIQANLDDMLVAKDIAHHYYETIREVIPQICKSVGVDRSRFEASVLRLLDSSVLDSVIHEMEQKANGLFLYASLVAQQLEEEKGLIDISKLLRRLPNGLSDIYRSNFARIGEWQKYKGVVAMIAAVREPLLASFAHKVDGFSGFEGLEALSVMFPVREGRIEVAHKSVIDWLLDESRGNEDYALNAAAITTAHQELAAMFLRRVRQCLQNRCEWEIKNADEETTFALRQVIYHLCHANMIQEAEELVLNFDWLLARCALKDQIQFAEDVERVRKVSTSSTITLLAKAIKLAVQDLVSDWRFLPSQLVGRLIGSEKKSLEVKRLLDTVRAWRGPLDNNGWWCPLQQTLEPAGGNILLSFKQANTVESIAWSPDCKHFVTNEEHSMRVWNADTGTCAQTLVGHTETVRCVAWSNDRICSGSDDETVRVWRPMTGECIQILTGHTTYLGSVCWSPDGSQICSGADTIRVWDLNENGQNPQILSGHSNHIACVAWSLDNSYLCSSSGSELFIWRFDNIEKKWQSFQEMKEGESVQSVAWSIQGKICSVGETVRIWNLVNETFECVQTLTDSFARCVAWNFEGTRLCFGNSHNQVLVWDLERNQCIQTLAADTGEMIAVAYSKDGRVCSGGELDRLRVFDVANDIECVEMLKGHESNVTAVAWSCDGKVCTGSADEALRVWDSESGECVQLNAKGGSLDAIAFAIDGRVCSAGEVCAVWDAGTGELIQRLEDHEAPVTSVAWNADCSQICTGSFDSTLRVWVVETGECIQTFTVDVGAILAVAWSLEGEICSGGEDEIVRVWRVGNEECVQKMNTDQLVEYSNVINCVAWSKNSDMICSGARAPSVSVWEAKTGICLKKLSIPSSFDIEISFSAWTLEGRVFGENVRGEVCIWDIVSGEPVADASSALWSFRHSDKLKSQARSDGLGMFAETKLSVCPSNTQRAIAQSGYASSFIHPVVLLGGRNRTGNEIQRI